jgi:alkylmercury lyase
VITWPRRDATEVHLDTASAIWGTFCHHSYLFPSRTAAQQWATTRDDIEILTLDEGFRVAQTIAGALLRYERVQERPA